MQPSTLGVAVGFKSIRRRRNKLTATQPWDEDDSDLGASLRKLFSATARNRAASLGRKTPREARKRSSYRVNTSVFGLAGQIHSSRVATDGQRAWSPERVEGKGVRVTIYTGAIRGVMSYLLAFYRNGFRCRERAATLETGRKRAKELIEELSTGVAHVAPLSAKLAATVNEVIEILKPIGVPLTEAV